MRVMHLAHTLHVYVCFLFTSHSVCFPTKFILISLAGPSRRQRVHLINSWKRWHTMPFCNPKYHYLIMALQRHYNPPWKITQPSVSFRNDAIVHLTGVQSNKSRVFLLEPHSKGRGLTRWGKMSRERRSLICFHPHCVAKRPPFFRMSLHGLRHHPPSPDWLLLPSAVHSDILPCVDYSHAWNLTYMQYT